MIMLKGRKKECKCISLIGILGVSLREKKHWKGCVELEGRDDVSDVARDSLVDHALTYLNTNRFLF